MGFGVVVMIVQVRRLIPFGVFHSSQRPAKEKGSPPLRCIK